jgi:hypothetical protein
MSPCCIEDQMLQDLPAGAGTSIHDREGFAKAKRGDQAAVALSAAFATESGPPPLFVDVTATRQWVQHLPIERGKLLRALGIDFGRQDSYAHIPTAARQLAAGLRDAGANVELDEYDGDHRNKIGGRVSEYLLPFFRRTLSFAQ